MSCDIFQTLITSFFTVIGGALPIAILIYLFSKEEKMRLLAHAEQIKSMLPLQEELLKKMSELINRSINPNDLDKSLDHLKQLIENQNMIEENKKFIKYAKDYNFLSAIGHVLRMSNYIPRNIGEHKEIAKNLPGSTPNKI